MCTLIFQKKFIPKESSSETITESMKENTSVGSVGPKYLKRPYDKR
jgi:hypothetical protein